MVIILLVIGKIAMSEFYEGVELWERRCRYGRGQSTV
jgi:hypothetical protein